MTELRKITGTATREGRWWRIELPELGAVTQARTPREIQGMAEDVAALWLDVDPARITVEVQIEIPAVAREKWEVAKSKAAAARAEEAEAAALSREAVQALRADGLSLSDTGRLLGLSPQRVHQLERS